MSEVTSTTTVSGQYTDSDTGKELSEYDTINVDEGTDGSDGAYNEEEVRNILAGIYDVNTEGHLIDTLIDLMKAEFEEDDGEGFNISQDQLVEFLDTDEEGDVGYGDINKSDTDQLLFNNIAGSDVDNNGDATTLSSDDIITFIQNNDPEAADLDAASIKLGKGRIEMLLQALGIPPDVASEQAPFILDNNDNMTVDAFINRIKDPNSDSDTLTMDDINSFIYPNTESTADTTQVDEADDAPAAEPEAEEEDNSDPNSNAGAML